jgi:hypothetical protein
LSGLSCCAGNAPENKFSPGVAEAKKSFLPLHPASTGGGNELKSGPKKNKKFFSFACYFKTSSYLCTPNRQKGN